MYLCRMLRNRGASYTGLNAPYDTTDDEASASKQTDTQASLPETITVHVFHRNSIVRTYNLAYTQSYIMARTKNVTWLTC